MMFFRKQSDSCSRFLLVQEDYLQETLDSSAWQSCESHLARCVACRQAVEDARSTAALLRASVPHALLPDPGFPLRVTAAIRAAEDSRMASARLFWSPLEYFAARMALVAGLAAALLAAVVAHDSISTPYAAGDFPDIASARDFTSVSPPAPLDRDSMLRAIAEGSYGK